MVHRLSFQVKNQSRDESRGSSLQTPPVKLIVFCPISMCEEVLIFFTSLLSYRCVARLSKQVFSFCFTLSIYWGSWQYIRQADWTLGYLALHMLQDKWKWIMFLSCDKCSNRVKSGFRQGFPMDSRYTADYSEIQ